MRPTWRDAARALTRPYRVTWPMVLLVALVPGYLVVAGFARAGAAAAPALALDRLIPVVPLWSLIYGALYVFLIVAPVILVQQQDLIDRTVRAYLAVWLASYLVFLLYPTVAPRPEAVAGDGFAAWGLRFLYEADPPYNCFPSLHVAHSFVSALACFRVHRALGGVTLGCAALVAVSTLFTRQHYVVDVVAGTGLALLAYAVFMRGHSRAGMPEAHRQVAPLLAAGVAGMSALGLVVFWVAYRLGFVL